MKIFKKLSGKLVMLMNKNQEMMERASKKQCPVNFFRALIISEYVERVQQLIAQIFIYFKSLYGRVLKFSNS